MQDTKPLNVPWYRIQIIQYVHCVSTWYIPYDSKASAKWCQGRQNVKNLGGGQGYVMSVICLFFEYPTRAIITRGLYIFYRLFEGQKRFFQEIFSENSAFMYGKYSRAVCNQERVMMARVRYKKIPKKILYGNL